jgi:hypothetical protein
MSKPEMTEVAAPWEQLGVTTLSMASVPRALDLLYSMDKKITLCLVGDTGVGKTPIVHQWVKSKENGFIYVLNFGHMTPEEISMSMFNENATSYGFVPPEWFLEINEKAKHGPVVFFMDEFNRGDKQLVNALFTLCDERRIHNHFLHPNVLLVAAMNPSNGSYLVNSVERDHAIRKRLNFVFVMPDLASWLLHARQEEYFEGVIDFVKAMPATFYDAAARDAGKAFPCPSNWEKISNLCKSAKKMNMLTDSETLSLISGQIGHATAEIFMGYLQDSNTVIAASAVLEEYHTTGRKRVAKLLGADIDHKTNVMSFNRKDSTRPDVLATLNEGIAMTLFSDKPDITDIGENLAQYLCDIPKEFFQTFLTGNVSKYLKQGGGNIEYMTKLNRKLNTFPRFAQKTKEMQEANSALSKGLSATP